MLSATAVKKIAHLARIEIEDQSIDSYVEDLNSVLALMAQMNELNINGIKPMAHPIDQMQVLRSDLVIETDQRDYFQVVAPQTESGLYLVPKVIE